MIEFTAHYIGIKAIPSRNAWQVICEVDETLYDQIKEIPNLKKDAHFKISIQTQNSDIKTQPSNSPRINVNGSQVSRHQTGVKTSENENKRHSLQYRLREAYMKALRSKKSVTDEEAESKWEDWKDSKFVFWMGFGKNREVHWEREIMDRGEGWFEGQIEYFEQFYKPPLEEES